MTNKSNTLRFYGFVLSVIIAIRRDDGIFKKLSKRRCHDKHGYGFILPGIIATKRDDG